MVKIANEILELQQGKTFLHSYRVFYIKILIIVIALASRVLGFYTMLFTTILTTILILYVKALYLYIYTLSAWLMLSSIIMLLNYVFSTLSLEVILNLVYGFTSFTSLALFFITTPPKHVRMVIGFNAFSLAYLFLRTSIKDMTDVIDVLKARGWSAGANPLNYIYMFRAIGITLITKINNSIDSIKARGAEE